MNNISIRNGVQIAFSFLMLYLGWRLYLFTQYFFEYGSYQYVTRPAAVDGFLPISALMSLKLWISTGFIDPHHPAALIILLAILTISLVFKKGFCSWLCPVGTISEGTGRMGVVLLGRNIKLPTWLDLPLMSLKYLLLGLFMLVIWFQMDPFYIAMFLQSNYNKVADIKMMYFFLEMSMTTAIVLSKLFLLSVFIKNFWCRYLCPYGALLGIIGIFSPYKVTRDHTSCTTCGKCDQVCPNNITVSKEHRIYSPECTSCLNCVSSCPKTNVLRYSSKRPASSINPKLYPFLLLTLFFLVISWGKLSGNWHSIVSYEEYKLLIQHLDSISH